MAQEDFLKQLWRAVRQASPTVTADSDSVDASAIERRLAATDLWLTPKIVDGYDPADFSEWPPTARAELSAAVEGFVRVATDVPPARTASPEERAAGAEWFGRILDVVGPIIRDAWVSAIEALVAEAERWCRTRDWPTRRYPKVIAEPLIGRYDTAQLLVHIPEGRFMLSPVSRFVAGGTGLIDLYAMPTLGGRSVVRRDAGWVILSGSARGEPKRWSEAAFEHAILFLAREAA